MPDVTYVGTVKSLIEKKGGWFTVEIDARGKSYTIKADTKLEPLLKLAREVRDAGLVATFTVSETESENINPNTGKPYTERRLEKIEEGEHAPQNAPNATASPSGGQQGSGGGDNSMSKEEWRNKDAAADKRALIAIAVSALTHTMPADPSEEDLEKFLGRVSALTIPWHRTVSLLRDGEDDVPF